MNIDKSIKKTQINNGLGNLIVSLIIGSQFINSLLCVMFSTEEGVISELFIIIGILLVIKFFTWKFRVRIERQQLAFIFLIVIGYVITSIVRGNTTSLTSISFICRCLIPLIIGATIDFDPKNVLRNLMVMMVPGLPFITILFAKDNIGNYDAVSMGTSYAILPILLGGITHFALFRKQSSIFERMLYVVTAIYMFFFIMMSYRGALLSMLLLIMLLYIFRPNGKHSLKKYIFIFFCFFILIIYALFKYQIIALIVSLLSSAGIRIATLDKTLILAARADTLHGRSELFSAAINGIMKSPVFGHGYATFKAYTGYIYPHNMVLQMFFDFGIPIGLVILSYIFIRMINKLRFYNKTNDAYFCFLLMIICSSIPRVMVSAEMWIVIILWFLIGLISRNNMLPESVEMKLKYD